MKPFSTDRTYVGPCFFRSIDSASSRLELLYARGLANTGLRPFDFAILSELNRNPGSTLNELEDVFCLDRHALKYRLRPLEAAGFVVVSPDLQDRRVRRVALTDAGRTKLDDARPLWLEVQRRFEAILGEEAASTFRLRAQIVASRSFTSDFEAV